MNPEISILKKRVYAFTTDLGIVVTVNYFMMASFNQFIQTVFFHFPLKAQLFLINKLAMMTSISLMSLTFAYFSLFYFMTNGRTMGKSLFGLQAKNANGEELTLNQSMMRALAYFTCAMTGSFLFALSYIRKDQKSLADVFSGTTVGIDSSEEKASGTEFAMTLVAAQESVSAEEVKEDDFNQAA